MCTFPFSSQTCGQIQFETHPIVGGEFAADVAESVYAIDIDSDGDVDVLSAGGNEIAWCENLMINNMISNTEDQTLSRFLLYHNYPNPFNPNTSIRFDVRKTCELNLKIFDIQGLLISILIYKELVPEHYQVKFEAKDIASDIYFYHIKMGNYTETKKMIFSR